MSSETPITKEEVKLTLSHLIISASGWRGVFAANGDPKDRTQEITPPHSLIVREAALAFAAFLRAKTGVSSPVVLVGYDTRPTGPAIARAILSALLETGANVCFAGVVAAPEIMAAARVLRDSEYKIDGFIYISASHNPIGHNGLKFGLTDGGVLSGGEAALLAADFRARVTDTPPSPTPPRYSEDARENALSAVYAKEAEIKSAALSAYMKFAQEVTSPPPLSKPLTICADLNGSARAASIDREFFTRAGLKFLAINDVPGKIAHRIVPEGESLEPCARFLAETHAKDPSALIGYTPDCDGDRGNLVVWDGERARPLEAQEVFALTVVSELCHLVVTGELIYDSRGRAQNRAAVAVNDPTSLRVDEIAAAFGVSVFRAEVGEANVVGLARKLRAEGWTVRILGEGAAGGTITHPSAVRDPLCTVMALVKLLRADGYFKTWCARRGLPCPPDFTLRDALSSLPACATTGAYTEEAVLSVKTPDHGKLKACFQRIFEAEWAERKEEMAKLGFTTWQAFAYNGLVEKKVSDFSEAGRGGLRIVFSNDEKPVASLWMRGSGTEPVFRVMADVPQTPHVPNPAPIERTLIQWLRNMVSRADNA